MNAPFDISATRLAELGQILRERSLTDAEFLESKALEKATFPARVARIFAEMPKMPPMPHDAHVQLWQARKRADDAVRGLLGFGRAFPFGERA